MRLGDIRECLDEDGASVEGLRSTDPTFCTEFVGFVDDFLIEFKERFDVVGGEGDGDEDQILLALGDVIFDGVGGLGSEPGGGSDLRLPAEAPRVGEGEALHDGVDGGGDFGGVGVATVDDGHGKGVGGEKEDDVRAAFRRVGGEDGFDVTGEGFDEAGVGGPAVDDGPGDCARGGRVEGGVGGSGGWGAFAFEACTPFPEFIQGAAGCRAGVLGILGEGYSAATSSSSKTVI